MAQPRVDPYREPSTPKRYPDLQESKFVLDGTYPLDTVKWVKREVPELGNGSKHFVEAPEDWSDHSINIAAIHYIAPDDHDSIRSLFHRVVDTLYKWVTESPLEIRTVQAEAFRNELAYILVNRIGSFNSPVYFNMGLEDDPLCSGCFVNTVTDSMESITDLTKVESRIFKRGAGAGANWSALRSSHEKVHGMGNSSGPVAFMSSLDKAASVIKSGGRKRRAARLDRLDVDHPDIMEFINVKADVEKLAHALVRQGWSTDMNDPRSINNILPFQSTNISVGLTNAFMEAYAKDEEWELRYRNQKGVHSTVKARDVMHAMAQACWECGDPGAQFHDTINDWSLLQDIEIIRSSNPCGEYVGPDSSSCNLAAINVLPPNRDPLSMEEIEHVARTFILAQETIVDRASYPSDAITEGARRYRALGLGWCNLGALCMHHGHPYDSDAARSLVADIVSTTTAAAYQQSINMAATLGPFHKAAECQEGIVHVFKKHRKAARDAALRSHDKWRDLVEDVESGHLPRNSAVTLSQPTGTVGMLMDVDTTGPEPPLALSVTKKLSYGGEMTLTVRALEAGLRMLGYRPEQIMSIKDQVTKEGHIEGLVKDDHLPVFDTAFPSGPSGRCIPWQGHVKMVAAMQPFLSMAISKTINLPRDATVEDIEHAYAYAWKKGVKCISLYRDDSKASQAIYANREEAKVLEWGQRRKMPNTRKSVTHKFELSGTEMYVTVGFYPDGAPGEVFIVASKQGSTINGLMDTLSITISHALQYGCPVSKLYEKFTGTKFAPDGWGTIGTQNYHFTSIVDYIFRWLAHEFPEQCGFEPDEPSLNRIVVEDQSGLQSPLDVSSSEVCPSCGNFMVPHGGGNCYFCQNCGQSEGGCG
jgi:ribonucleoside-diphosphate reductase alpha chain